MMKNKDYQTKILLISNLNNQKSLIELIYYPLYSLNNFQY